MRRVPWINFSGYRIGQRLAHAARRFHRDERGQYLIQTVILLPMLMILTGLVIDGGWMYWQYRRAEITVSAAAQAASHAIDVEYFRQTNQVQLNLGEAWDVAQGFIWINQRGHMQVQGIWVGEDEIVVAATAYVDTLFLRFAGINRLPLRAIGRAYPAFGINREGQ
jgi:uncharacterized membrane protein